MTNGDVLDVNDVNVRSLVPVVTLQFPQELGVPVTGHSRPADRAQKVHKQDAILIPKDSGDNFSVDGPVRNFRALMRMFLLQ